MIILVLGNGFDLAHNLATKYSSFLDFIKIYKDDAQQEYNNDAKIELKTQIDEFKLRKDNIAIEVYNLIKRHNRLLEHFLDIYISRCTEGKDGWIDCTLPDFVYFKLAPFIFSNREYPRDKMYEFRLDLLEEQARHLLDDLNVITRLFEIYLTEFVESVDTNLRIPEIYKLGNKVDAVLSFNYTDTYRRLYRMKEDVDCCFIHGKANKESNIKTCNLVLGIDEYLENKRKDIDNRFIWFRKFYQRIYKETSTEYIDWLNDDIEEQSGKKEKLPLYIYFYGHSLDITDRDILRRLIMHENAIVRIFYYNKREMGKLITNLTKIIGQENLIHMTRGRDRKIEFIPSSEARGKVFLNL